MVLKTFMKQAKGDRLWAQNMRGKLLCFNLSAGSEFSGYN